MNEKINGNGFLKRENQDLSDDDLETVAGGMDGEYNSGFGKCYLCNSTNLEIWFHEGAARLYCNNCHHSFDPLQVRKKG